MSLVTFERRFFAGIDVGQVNDSSAIAVVERIRAVPRANLHHGLIETAREEAKAIPLKIDLGHLERIPLGTMYPAQVEIMRTRRDEIVAARDRMAEALRSRRSVQRVWDSDANFLLVRFADTNAAMQAIMNAGLLVREFRGAAGFGDALRITIGRPDQNARLLGSLA